jgi:hypothetical protein
LGAAADDAAWLQLRADADGRVERASLTKLHVGFRNKPLPLALGRRATAESSGQQRQNDKKQKIATLWRGVLVSHRRKV